VQGTAVSASPRVKSLRGEKWSRLSEQIFRVAKWSLRRDYAAMRVGSEVK
jgi:hypothetical protein